MKIDHFTNSSPAIVPIKNTLPGSARAASTSPDSTSVSVRQDSESLSLSVNQAARQISADDFNTTRVEKIRSAIHNGTLSMDASKIADNALSDAKLLLAAQAQSA